MYLLLLGLALWVAGHFFKRLLPELRESLGMAGKGLAAALVLAGTVLMVRGFRGWDAALVWQPPGFMVHINNLLMLLAFYLLVASLAKTRITRAVRHPQLAAVKAWAVAHLLVNGDLASIVLFGGLLAWAVAEVVAINRAAPGWTPPPPAPAGKEAIAVAATLAAFGAVAAFHIWLGYWPFPG